MPVRRAATGLFLLALIAIGGCGGGRRSSEPAASTPATTPSPVPAAPVTAVATPTCAKGRPGDVPDTRIVSREIEVDGVTRSYLVYVADSYDGDAPAPAVFTFHGAGSTAAQQLAYTNFGPGAEQRGGLVVAPQALNEPTAWSPYGFGGEVDDLDFFQALLEAAESEFCIDPGRVFVSGMSSGGFMASAVACEFGDEISAAGPATATFYRPRSCDDTGPVPYTYFHGTADPVVDYYGPAGPDAEPGPGNARYNAQQWADHNNCDPDPVAEDLSPEVTRFRWEGCAAPTEFFRINGGGHTWPGAIDLEGFGLTTHEISATDVLWNLFDGSGGD